MNKTINNTLAVLGGIGAGAAAMYFLDPDQGTRRGERFLRDKAVGLKNDAGYAISGKAKDLKNRAQGLAHEAKSLLAGVNGITGQDKGTRHPASTEDAGIRNPANNVAQGKIGIG